MAKFLSQIFTVISGSIGGVTFYTSPSAGICARARTAPVNPRTNAQSAIRSALSQANAMWKAASAETRDLWNAYALTCTFSGPTGDYQLTGRQIFVANLAFACWAKSVGGVITPADDPPTIDGVLKLEAVAPATPVTIGTCIAANVTVTTPEDIVVVATRSPAFGPSRYRYNGPWLADEIVHEEFTAPLSQLIEFENLVEDSYYFVRLRAITTGTPHRLSAEYVVRCQAEVIAA